MQPASAPLLGHHLPDAATLYQQASMIDLSPWVAQLPPPFHRSFLGMELWQYSGLAVLLALSVIVGKALGRLAERACHRILNTRAYSWGDSLNFALHVQFQIFFGAWFVQRCLKLLELPADHHDVFVVAAQTCEALAISWAMLRTTDVITAYLRHRASRTETRLDDQLVPLADRLMKIGVVILGLLVVLQAMHVDVGSLMAGLGIGGVAFALAAQSTLANLLGSVTIFMDRPFQIGDWIRTSEIDGTVESVGFRSTRVRTWENSVVTVPNAKLVDATINNLGARAWRRSRNVLSLTYDTPPERLEAFVEGLRALLRVHPKVRKDLYDVHFFAFGSHSLDVLFQFHLQANNLSEEWTTQHEVFLEVLRLARVVGVQFALPTQTLHIASLVPPREAAPAPAPVAGDLREAINGFGPGGAHSRMQDYRLTDGHLPVWEPGADPRR